MAIPTPSVCSTVSNSDVSMQAPAPSLIHILEISLISAQDLTPLSKSMRTYAVAWTHPSRKLTTRTDQHGHTHPTWNEKLTFRVDRHFLASDDASIHVEIYTSSSWFRESLVGTVRVLLSDLLLSPAPRRRGRHHNNNNMRFVALQVRRPSGAPQGILNMGVSLLGNPNNPNNPNDEDEVNFRNALEQKVNALHLDETDDDDDENNENKKITLWRSMSLGSEANDLGYNNNNNNNPGSMVNGSELCSDIGPSASIVAADLAMKFMPPQQQQPMVRRPSGYEDTGSSILGEMTMEEARAKGYRVRSSRERWRRQVMSKDMDDDDRSDLSSDCGEGHNRRNSDSGMFSCFGTAYGIEFRIVCGSPSNPPPAKKLAASTGGSNSNNNNNSNSVSKSGSKKNIVKSSTVSDQENNSDT